MITRHRAAIAAYVAAQKHLREGRHGAKTVKQIAADIGTTTTTVRRWLRRDHRSLWMDHWPSANELWAAQRERLRDAS
jgi:predicted transcriptional regulator